MKKTTHTAGTNSYARWSEDMVSHLLFKKIYMILLTFPLLLFFRGKLILKKKQPHRAKVYLATHRKRGKGINEPVVCYMHMRIFANIKLFLFSNVRISCL